MEEDSKYKSMVIDVEKGLDGHTYTIKINDSMWNEFQQIVAAGAETRNVCVFFKLMILGITYRSANKNRSTSSESESVPERAPAQELVEITKFS